MRTLLVGGYNKKYRRASEVLEFGFYHRHLRTYRRLFPAEQICVTLHEDLVGDTDRVLTSVFGFLGVDLQWQPPVVGKRKQGLYSIPRLRYRQAIAPLIRTTTADGLRTRPRNGKLGIWARRLDSAVFAKVFTERKPELSSELRGELTTLYREDVRGLESQFGLSLGTWLATSS